jgi:hypothetical protein
VPLDTRRLRRDTRLAFLPFLVFLDFLNLGNTAYSSLNRFGLFDRKASEASSNWDGVFFKGDALGEYAVVLYLELKFSGFPELRANIAF